MKLYSVVPYLLLVSFLTGPADGFTPEMAGVLKGSPYSGVAVVYQKAYEHGPVDQPMQVEMFKEITRISGKDVWPWVFFNRIVGHVEGEGHGNPYGEDKKYFRKVRGFDIYGEDGELGEFLKNWRGAFRTARACGAPGVMVDFESYNNYKNYELDYLASQMGKTPAEVSNRLVAFGADLADMAAEEYPDAVVWSFFSGLGRGKCLDVADEGCHTVSLIVIGFLERCREKGYRLTFVAGGERSLGYCNKDVRMLNARIEKRAKDYAGAMSAYPSLRLGGVIAPWPDARLKTGWLLENRCAECDVKDAMGFVPFFRALADSYEYVWIYAAGLAGYNPFDTRVSTSMDKALGEAFGKKGTIPAMRVPAAKELP